MVRGESILSTGGDQIDDIYIGFEDGREFCVRISELPDGSVTCSNAQKVLDSE